MRLVGLSGNAIGVGRGPEVIVTGDPLELVLYLQGRRAAAEVELAGHPDAIVALESADLGI